MKNSSGISLFILGNEKVCQKPVDCLHQSTDWWAAKAVNFNFHEYNLIANTTTAKGLIVGCGVDKAEYPIGTKISDEELNNVNIVRREFHGEWNYIIYPVKC